MTTHMHGNTCNAVNAVYMQSRQPMQCNPFFATHAVQLMQCNPCIAIHAMQPIQYNPQCNPCSANHAVQPMQCNPCNATHAVQPMRCINPYVDFLIVVSKLLIPKLAYIALALHRHG